MIYRFRAVWDRRDDECGTLEPYAIKYYLEDDTVEVAEIHERNDGKDPFPFLLKRIKLPKNWKLVPGNQKYISIVFIASIDFFYAKKE